MKRKTSILFVIGILGFIVVIAGFNEFKLLVSGRKVDLNTASISDFDKPALIDGKVDFVYGPFATLEETQKTYGVTTGKTETNFYIVGNFSGEMYESWENGELEFDTFYTVLSVADKDKQKELDAAAEDWVNYLTSEDENEAPPYYSIEIKGKLEKQVKDDDYKQYYSEAQDDLSNVSVEKDEYAELMITNGEVKATFTYVFFSLGLILGIGGIALGILSAVSDSKKKKLEEQSAMTNDETFNG